MHPLAANVGRALVDLAVRRTGLLVALSGGADSVALLAACRACQTELELDIVAGHLNHQLRGEQSDADAVWVQSLCQRLEIPLELGSADVAQRATATRQSLETAARAARYEFLEQAAAKRGCTAVAVAHTADDQAETVLHNLLRGTGLTGLAGIPRARALSNGLRLVRPLLDVSRREVESFLAAIGEGFRGDSTNLDQSYTRNRIRHDLLPRLKSDYNPQVTDCLTKLARQASEIAISLEYSAGELLQQVRGPAPHGTVCVRWRRMKKIPRHLQRELFVQIWKAQDWPRQAMTFDHWQRLAELVDRGGREQFPGGVEAERVGQLLVLRAAGNEA